ncbi:MAG: hypothetical protein ILP11_01240 [Alphaproteobacteria bacterium]|nr:hypothetical protein [Alphaproteobacteria bacterium]
MTICVFFACFGFEFLDFNNIDLVMIGGDFTNCYLGSVFYRIDAWRWPPLTMQNLGYPFGMSAYGSDISPLMSFIFKVLHTVFGASPEWQFVGLWTLICYILQAYVSVLIFRHTSKNKFLVVCGALFFVSTPIVLNRVLVHINLQPHFLLLFPMLLWLNNKLGKKEWCYMGILYSLAFLTCPYFLPMQTGFFALLWYQKLFVEKQLRFSHFIAALLILVGIGLFWMYMLGLFTLEHKLDSGGWAIYGLNLAAFLSPSWLAPAPKPSTTLMIYDMSVYLGLGVFVLMFLVLPSLKNLLKKETWHRYWPVFLLALGLFFFALSPRIRYNNHILFEYQPNVYLAWLGNTFRYSSRFFWPIWYLIVFFVIKAFYTQWGKRAVLLMGPILIVQLLDIYPLLSFKTDILNRYHSYDIKTWTEDRWQQLAQKYTSFFCFVDKGHEYLWRQALKYRHPVSYGLLNRPNPRLVEQMHTIRAQILSGYLDPPYKNYLFVLDASIMDRMMSYANINPSVKKLLAHVEPLDVYHILEYKPGMEVKPDFFDRPRHIAAQNEDGPLDLIQVSPYRLYQTTSTGLIMYATIISFDNDTLVVEWDYGTAGVKTYKKHADGVYHFEKQEALCIIN